MSNLSLKKICLTFFAILALIPSAEARKKRNALMNEISNKFTEATIAAPKDDEVCFSPDERCDLKLLKFIESAQKSIDIAIYDLNLDQIGHALLLKSKTIPVRIVFDMRQSKEKNSIVPMLIKAGLNLKIGHQRGIMHNKFAIIDGQRVETGSFNYTNHAYQANNENQVYLSTPAIVNRYKARFNTIWEEAKNP